MADSDSLSILMEISSWPCALFTYSALFTFNALIIFPIALAIISKEERVPFGVSSNGDNVLSRGGSRTSATSKMERFVIIVNG